MTWWRISTLGTNGAERELGAGKSDKLFEELKVHFGHDGSDDPDRSHPKYGLKLLRLAAASIDI